MQCWVARRVCLSLFLLLLTCSAGVVFRLVTSWCRYTIEYVAMVPNRQGPSHPLAFDVEWIELRYPDREDISLKQVTMRQLGSNEGDDVLANWVKNASLRPSGAMLTGRRHEDRLFVFLRMNASTLDMGGCCADTMRIFPRWGSGYKDIDLVQPVSHAFESARVDFVWGVSHSFAIGHLDHELHALCPVLYREPALSNVLVDGIVAVSLETGRLRFTAEGHRMFSIFEHLGTLKTARASSVWKVQFADQYRLDGQQWHINALERFTALDGTVVLAVCQRMDVEVLLIKCPFTYTFAQGGGSILQRFGSPPIIGGNKQVVGHHNFGLRGVDYWILKPGHPRLHIRAKGGVHNVYHKRYSDARETLTVFVNQVSMTDNVSGVYEFDVHLIHAQNTSKDEVFNTSYKKVDLDFTAMAQGGARPIKNDIWIVASGLAGVGYEVVDKNGNRLLHNYTKGNTLLYDPFVFVHGGTSNECLHYPLQIVLTCVTSFAALLVLTAACSWLALRAARRNRKATSEPFLYQKMSG